MSSFQKSDNAPATQLAAPSGGRMAALIRDRDWSSTSLGAPEGWPAALRIPLHLCLEAQLPAAVLWGPELIFFFNDAYARFLSGKEGRALGAPFFEVWPNRKKEFEPIFDAVFLRGESLLLHDRLVRLENGNASSFDVSYSPIRGDDGAPAGILALGNETTERLEAERRQAKERERMEAAFVERSAELVRSRAFLDSLIENLPNMVFVKDAKDLRFVRFNRAGEELLGMSRSELLGKSDLDFFPKEQAEHFVAHDRAVLAGRSIVDIPEEPIATKSGLRYLHTRKIPLLGADGNPEYLLGISDDITEKRESEAERLRLTREEAALLEREAANRRVWLLADASVTLASSLDYHETLQKLARLVVPALADWCTVTVRDSTGAFERVAAEHRDPARRALVEELSNSYPANGEEGRGTGYVINTGKSQFVRKVPENMLEKAAQSPRHLELMRALGTGSCLVVPIQGRERTHGAIALMAGESGREYNDDDLRTAEELGRRAGIAIDNAELYGEAQKAVASRDAFLSIASHELKTPLTSLTIQAQMRRRQLDRGNFPYFSPEKLVHMVESDARQLDRLTRLIDDMLDISRINSGRLTVHPEPVNLLQLVREVADRHQEQFAKAGCELTVDGDDQALGQWDRYRIEQVVTNLLTNALKYGAGHPVTAEVRQRERKAVLEVRDRGIGIAPEDQDRIFRQYERAVGPDAVSGLGLGLYIVKQILDLHGGSISVRSVPGEGTCFTVLLPVS